MAAWLTNFFRSLRNQQVTGMGLIVLLSIFLTGCTNPLTDRAKAGLQVMTNDVPASLFLDGQYLDKAPYISKDIRPGTYSLRVQPDDATLASYETTITLAKGLLSVLVWKPGNRPETSGGVMFEMTKLADRQRTELVIASIPDGAIVAIDNRTKEFAPTTITDLEPGEHEVTVSLPSYEALRHTVNLVAGHRVTVTVKLAKSTLTPSPTLDRTTPVASDSASASSSASPVPKITPAKTSTSAAQISGPKVKIKPTGYKVNGQEVLRVRDAASNSGREIGVAPVNSLYPYTGTTTDGWHGIEFNGTTGWVSGQYADIIR